MDAEQQKHLEMVQAVITRMAQNSFQLKAWGVVLVSGMVALGIYIDQCENQFERASVRGQSPFLRFRARDLTSGKGFVPANPISEFPSGNLDSQVAKYCWKANGGFKNIGEWVDRAAREVGK